VSDLIKSAASRYFVSLPDRLNTAFVGLALAGVSRGPRRSWKLSLLGGALSAVAGPKPRNKKRQLACCESKAALTSPSHAAY
jgi:hypothetical protein